MSTTRGRHVYTNQVVFDQADFFQSDGFTRVTGLTPAQLTCQLFFNNSLANWPLNASPGTTDAQVASGRVYWVEVPGSEGYYNVRWRPNAVGYWRLVITYPAGTQIMAQDYDVLNQPQTVDQGLKASFVRSG